MVELGEEMSEVEAEAEEVTELISEELLGIFDVPAKVVNTNYNVDKQQVSATVRLDEQTVNHIASEFEGVDVSMAGKHQQIQFTFSMSGDE